MKFLLSMHMNPAVFNALTEEERNEIMGGHGAFIDAITKSGELITTQALADPSQSAVVRVRGGQPAVTDGPYLEAKEHLGGFYLIDWCARSCSRPAPWTSEGRRRHRGPAARAGAAGPRRARPPARPVRGVRGRRA